MDHEEDAVPPRMSRAPAPTRAERRSRYRSLSIGGVMSDSITILVRYVLPVGFVSVLCFGLLTYVELQSIEQFRDSPLPYQAWANHLESSKINILDSLSYVIPYLLEGMVTFIALQHLRGRGPGQVAAVSKGLVGTLGALPTALTVAIVVGLLSLIPIGSIFGIIIQCGWFVAVPGAVSESASLGTALSRSWELTSGSKWHIFGITLIFGIVFAAAVFFYVFKQFESKQLTGTFEEMRTTVIVANAIMLPGVALLSIAAPVAYFHLRRGKEGAEPDELAAIFD